MLTVLVCPRVSKAALEATRAHMLSQGALLIIKGHDEGGYHANEDPLLPHTPFVSLAPWQFVVNLPNLGFCPCIRKFGPAVYRGENSGKEGRGGDDRHQEGKVMELILASVGILGPCISVVYISYLCFRRQGKVARKGGPIQVLLQGLEIYVGHLPSGRAIESDRIVVRDGLWLGGQGRRRKVGDKGRDVR